MTFATIRLSILLSALAGLPALAQSPVAFTNISGKEWRVVCNAVDTLDIFSDRRLGFRSTILEEGGQLRTELHDDGFDLTIPGKATLSLEVLDPRSQATPEGDVSTILSLKDHAGRSPGYLPHLTYAMRHTENGATARLAYRSPLDPEEDADDAVRTASATSIAIMAESWTPVILERALRRGCVRWLLGLW